MPSAIRAAVRAAAVSRVEEVHAKRTAAEAEDATAKRRKEEFDLEQLKVKRALIEDRTAHRRLLLRQCTERSAKALAAEAQAAERAWAKKVRCEFAAWLHKHLLDRMPKVHMPSLENRRWAERRRAGRLLSCPGTSSVCGLVLARTTT